MKNDYRISIFIISHYYHRTLSVPSSIKISSNLLHLNLFAILLFQAVPTKYFSSHVNLHHLHTLFITLDSLQDEGFLLTFRTHVTLLPVYFKMPATKLLPPAYIYQPANPPSFSILNFLSYYSRPIHLFPVWFMTRPAYTHFPACTPTHP